jgi:hypothetical protein
MAPRATRSANAMWAGVSTPRHWRCLGRRQSRFWGVGPTLALVALELGVFVLFGWLAGPFTILGLDGLDAHEALALPSPRVVVPALTQPGHQPSRRAIGTPPARVQIEEVGLVVRLRRAPSGGQTQAALSSASPVAGPADPSVRQGVSQRPYAIKASAAGQPGAQASHVRLARPQRASGGPGSRRQATLTTSAAGLHRGDGGLPRLNTQRTKGQRREASESDAGGQH